MFDLLLRYLFRVPRAMAFKHGLSQRFDHLGCIHLRNLQCIYHKDHRRTQVSICGCSSKIKRRRISIKPKLSISLISFP